MWTAVASHPQYHVDEQRWTGMQPVYLPHERWMQSHNPVLGTSLQLYTVLAIEQRMSSYPNLGNLETLQNDAGGELMMETGKDLDYISQMS